MGRLLKFLQCVGQAVVAKGLRVLAGLVPFGEALWEVAEDAGKRLQENQSDAELRAEVEAVAQASPQEVKQAAVTVVAEVAAQQPPAVQQALTAYLTQVPAALRRSLKRRDDPRGLTVPDHFTLDRPEQVLAVLPPRLPRFKPGDRPAAIGEWELLDLLGAGGFGEVWKARHAVFHGTEAAIKFCLDPLMQRELLQHEAKILNEVMRHGRHPGVVPLLDANLKADPPWLRYEYIEGGDLAQVVRDCADETPAERVVRANRVIGKLAAVVGHFHRLQPQVVHRDLKPANVLIQPLSDGNHALRVADFGIGSVVAQRTLEQVSRLPTSRGEELATVLRGAFTPLYASPQQKRPGSVADVRDDVYALGVIWYQLLTGDLSAERPGGLDWADDLREAGMSEAAVRLLGACVADKPEKRPADAAVLVERLRAMPALMPSTSSTTPVKITPPSLPQPERKAGERFTNTLGMQFAWIPPGTFLMGSPKSEEGREGYQGADETQHRVTLTKGFFMGMHLVTQEQWQHVMGSNPSHFKGTAHLPVEQVSWDDCQEFCRKLRAVDGKPYRLPTEAEWEYACRAGTTTPFYFGATLSVEQANYDGNYTYGKGRKGVYREKTTPVGSFPANAWGLTDMHGNLLEWCQDWYGTYATGDLKDLQGSNSGDARVLRGGSWGDVPQDCRAASRGGGAPDVRISFLGCRLVCSLD